MVSMLRRYGINDAEVWHQCCRDMASMLRRYGRFFPINNTKPGAELHFPGLWQNFILFQPWQYLGIILIETFHKSLKYYKSSHRYTGCIFTVKISNLKHFLLKLWCNWSLTASLFFCHLNKWKKTNTSWNFIENIVAIRNTFVCR